jgi:hypothetical protein
VVRCRAGARRADTLVAVSLKQAVHASGLHPLPGGSHAAPPDAPEHFLGSSALLDLKDAKLRLRAHSLTQLCKSDREKAMAVHNYVKKLPFERGFKLRLRTARAVMDAGRGDASDKAALLVALLRSARIPARLRYVEIRNGIMRGLAPSSANAFRPVAEVWLAGRWLRTDSYIYDSAYMAAARQRLKDRDWECGYGIHRNGQSVWNGSDDAFIGGFPTEQDPLVVRTFGVYDDPLQFAQSDLFRKGHRPFAHLLKLNMRAFGMRNVVRKLREEGSVEPQRTRKRA